MFTSPRERRLWFLALASVVAIYATLGLAGRLAQQVTNPDVYAALFAVGFFAIIAVILTSGWQVRLGSIEIAFGLGVGLVYYMIFVRMGVPILARTHLFEYGVVAIFMHQALLERNKNGRAVKAPAILAIVITGIFGWVDEGIQWLLPNRYYDINDVIVNVTSAILAVTATSMLAWVRKKITPQSS